MTDSFDDDNLFLGVDDDLEEEDDEEATKTLIGCTCDRVELDHDEEGCTECDCTGHYE